MKSLKARFRFLRRKEPSSPRAKKDNRLPPEVHSSQEEDDEDEDEDEDAEMLAAQEGDEDDSSDDSEDEDIKEDSHSAQVGPPATVPQPASPLPESQVGLANQLQALTNICTSMVSEMQALHSATAALTRELISLRGELELHRRPQERNMKRLSRRRP
ncbi:protein Aatf-like [Rhinatrema bivittatum]|uniref:protein Aatf-like n=1 Tax=Rhinatrema bivittatum TaxID=194408 RepID=UPI00112A4898|nr:protein Aatf-like [Rhinatrema bivittatum]